MRTIVILIIAALFFSCSGEAQIYPDENWSVHEASQSIGWDNQDVSNFERYIIDSTNITGLVIVHKGQIILD